MLDENLMSRPKPPQFVWIITRERVRSGKAPFKVETHDWIYARATPLDDCSQPPWALRSKPGAQSDGKLYALSNCFASLHDAKIRLQQICADERADLRRKRNALESKLTEAAQLTNNLEKTMSG